ncbi:hypothetical protein [Streptomyces tendae]
MNDRRKDVPKRLVVLVTLSCAATVLAGCGSSREESVGRAGGDEKQAYSEIRSRAVAEAWEGSEAADIMRDGYYPMSDVLEPPEGGFHSEADKRAFATGNFVLLGTLTDATRRYGKIVWGDGGSALFPLLEAGKVYSSLDKGNIEGPNLKVTGVTLGEMAHLTNRGPATVPAWLFTLDGYESPVKRVAVSPSALPEAPIDPARDISSSELTAVGSLMQVAAGGRSLIVQANHGACDGGPEVRVLETSTSIVLSASVLDPADGPCHGIREAERVHVKLDRPVDGRIVLDAFTGAPVRYGD